MLIVKTKVAPSSIQGLGLFADEHLTAGQPIWRYTPGWDVIFSEDEVKKLPDTARDMVLHYGYQESLGIYILNLDDARFYNHANNPNTVSLRVDGADCFVAARAIEVGEELTCDYRPFDLDWNKKLSPE